MIEFPPELWEELGVDPEDIPEADKPQCLPDDCADKVGPTSDTRSGTPCVCGDDEIKDDSRYCNPNTRSKEFDSKQKCTDEANKADSCKEKSCNEDGCNGFDCNGCTIEGEDGEQVPHTDCVCSDKECLAREDLRSWGECGNDDDGICPQGCYIWWDDDCGGEDNIFTVGFDIAWRYFGWGEDVGEWWRESVLGDIMILGWPVTEDPWDYLEESWCNPRKDTPGHPEHAAQSAVYCGTGTVCGWVGGERVLYNETNTTKTFLYTIQWMVGNIKREGFEISYLNDLGDDEQPVAHYKITLSNDEVTYIPIPADPTKDWISIGLGAVNDGDDTVRSFFSQKNYTTICLKFQEKIYGYNDYCRDISTDTWNQHGEAVTSPSSGSSGDTDDDGEHDLGEDSGGVRPE